MEPDKTSAIVVKALRLMAHEEAKALFNRDELPQMAHEQVKALVNRDELRQMVREELSSRGLLPRRNNVKKSSSESDDESDSLSEKFKISSSESDDESKCLELSPSRSRDHSPKRPFEISKALATYFVCLLDWGLGLRNRNTVQILNTGTRTLFGDLLKSEAFCRHSKIIVLHEPTLAFPCHVYPILNNYKLTLAEISDFIRYNPMLGATEVSSDTLIDLDIRVHMSSRQFSQATAHFLLDSLHCMSLRDRIQERWPKLAQPLEVALPEGNKFLKACSINLQFVKNEPDWFNPRGALTEFLKVRGD